MNQFCEFCDIYKSKKHLILYQDDKVFAFHDISKATAREHVLVCPIEHIDNFEELKSQQTLQLMHKVGREILQQLNNGNQFRFGFHSKRTISINHLHLHCFVLPFESILKDKMVYGYLLNSVEVVAKFIRKSKLPKL